MRTARFAACEFRDSCSQQFFQLAGRDQALQVARAADQHALDENHRQGRPAGPHFQRQAGFPFAEIVPVFQIPVSHGRCVQRLASAFRKGVLPHAYHHDIVGGNRSLNFAYDASVVAGDGFSNRRMDVGLIENDAAQRRSPGRTRGVEGYCIAECRARAKVESDVLTAGVDELSQVIEYRCPFSRQHRKCRQQIGVVRL